MELEIKSPGVFHKIDRRLFLYYTVLSISKLPRGGSMTVQKRVQALQAALKSNDLFACIIPSTDPHMSEYVAPRWEGRAWISGFAGSAGTAVISVDGAALWTDGRYFLEAGQVLDGSGIELMKMGLPETPSIEDWLTSRYAAAGRAGHTGRVRVAGESFPLGQFQQMARSLDQGSLLLEAGDDLLDEIWKDRPGLPGEGFYEVSADFTGETRRQRLDRLAGWITEHGYGAVLLSALDEIAWTLNLRGSDVECNPVFYGYLLFGPDGGTLFTHGEDMDPALVSALQDDRIDLARYSDIFDALKDAKGSVASDPGTLNVAAAGKLDDRLRSVASPVKLWKAVKTGSELASTRRVMERDGVAMVKLLHWIEKSAASGDSLDELTISNKITELRSAGSSYVGDSFPSIVGFAGHGAIVHYRVDRESSSAVEGNGLLLIDSGGQYADGTTDITRTLAVGNPSPEQIDQFTLVLKGNIALSSAVFPRGTTGLQLDTLARLPLWNRGLNYGHGTGHGVGFALNVHEGPQSISTRFIDQQLLAGMIVSNEPGFYAEGSHGIRIENLEAVVDLEDRPGFLGFETLTLCPIELEMINRKLLTEEEVLWINDYHQMVWKRLSPELDSDLRLWLQHKTRKL
jgi:Xaa-Pro aminopeptidase